MARHRALNRHASDFVGAALRLFGLAALRLFSRRACFLAGPLSRFFGLALRLSLGRSTSFLFGSLSRLLRLALRRPRRFASFFFGAALGLSLDRDASFLFGLALRCRASLFVGATLRVSPRGNPSLFLGAALCSLGRTSARLLFGLALPLRGGAGCHLGAVLGFFCPTSLCLSRRLNASDFFSAALRSFCLATLRLPHGCSTGLALVAPPSRAHDDPDDRGCERKANPADDERQLHD
ncbi:MAG TPA: hypothetical protein PKC43_14455 [Phycisphaerales bacterium]|nr:hypothetical protein [Phycisphaerales bacterium]HMP38636.1 hypothetical protein [Phycisphaerales bacterium]